MRVLIEAGADVNAKDAIQDSPYLYAGARGHLEILRMTLAHGADLRLQRVDALRHLDQALVGHDALDALQARVEIVHADLHGIFLG